MRGDSDELWLAHIQVVNKVTKTCNVYFYVPYEDDSNKYHKESGGRLERVHLNSIIGTSKGNWLSSNLYYRESIFIVRCSSFIAQHLVGWQQFFCIHISSIFHTEDY